jgi:hypothetical protein
MHQHLASMRSNPIFKKVHHTLFMRNESKRLRERLVLENTRLLKNRLEESQSERNKEKDCLTKFQPLDNMRSNRRFRTDHNIRFTKRENIKLNEQLVQENMRLHRRRLRE